MKRFPYERKISFHAILSIKLAREARPLSCLAYALLHGCHLRRQHHERFSISSMVVAMESNHGLL